ncbi:MAG TPA: acyl-CoA dehydrogenase family protein [Stellaceae bacterium]|jgi:alkylation response protein AidB-like acyl-CoA dehydrogenase|nr:acyl-CoA dehydrogenase family protein [Stellaceae bacterium]
MDSGIDNLDRQLAQLTATFAADAAAHDRDGSFPRENFALLHRHGLLSLTVPTDFGGGGAGLATAMRVIAAVARGEPSTALILAMQYLYLQRAGAEPWPAHLRERVYRDAVMAGALGNALRVEPEQGTPLRGGLPATTARRVPEGWSISGHKLYSTGVAGLTWLGVWARTDEDEPRVGTFLVPAGSTGIRIVESWDHLGMRATGSHETLFDNVVVPEDHAVDIRPPAQWMNSVDPLGLAWNVTLIGAIYDAIARNARDWLVEFLAARKPSNLGAPLSSLPRMQEAVGLIEALVFANRKLLDDAATAVDRGRPPSAVEAGLVKFLVTQNAVKAVETALELTGNHGLSRNNPLERHYRDVMCSRIHSPQNDSILTAAGRARFARRQDAAA